MDFSLNSSVVLAAIVGLWLIWVAPYLLRRSQPIAVAGSAHNAFSGTATRDAGFQRSVMTMSVTDDSPSAVQPSTAGRAGKESPKVETSTPGLRIRWGRLAVALAGAGALAGALVTTVLAVIGVISSLVPLTLLLIGIGSIVTLRTFAVRGRRRARVAVQPAREKPVSPAAPEKPVVQRPTSLFNAEDTGGRSPNAENKNDGAGAQITAAELRAAALAVAAEVGDPLVGAGTPWQPVEVPKPTYVEAPKAEREDPAPLDLPETPRPQAKTSIKNGAIAPKVETDPSPRMNLDDILQRRRA